VRVTLSARDLSRPCPTARLRPRPGVLQNRAARQPHPVGTADWAHAPNLTLTRHDPHPVIGRFEELDWQSTPMGDLTLRRRTEPSLGVEVFEVNLGEEYLMSSLFTVAEEELSNLGLAETVGDDLTVLVGGLGLGYTAIAALRDPRVASMTVIDMMPAVIDWHERGLLPVSSVLTGDARTRLVLDDFFAVMRREPAGDVRYDAILLDVDHSPRHQLDPSHADLYTESGLRALARHLTDRGIFALWSDDPPDTEFMVTLAAVFDAPAAHVVDFDNALTGGVSSNTVYVARARPAPASREN
jgi:spermidine synthase